MTVTSVEHFDGPAGEWNAFAAAQSGFTHCLRYEWRGVIERVFGHECFYLCTRSSNGAIEAVLPLVRVKSLVFGHFMVSMPFLNYGGPVGTRSGVQQLVAHAATLAHRERAKLLELRSAIPLPIDLPVSHRKVAVILDLEPTPDATFRRFDGKLRSQIRRSQREGATIALGHTEVEPFFRIFSEHMRDLGTPTQSQAFFAEIARAFPEDSWFACVYLDGRPVAGGCGFVSGDAFELTWAASLRAYNRQAPNMMLYWELMQRAVAHGLKRFNFGRCTPGGGSHRFKLQWGGHDEQLWWYDSARRHAITPSPESGPFRWAPRVWRRLPIRITTALGPAIVRYLP